MEDAITVRFTEFLESLNDKELDQFLWMLDRGDTDNEESIYDFVAKWIAKNRRELTDEIFGGSDDQE